ncbi:CFI-box-CTERM domain-containing protein, partial [Chloroflexota bacterium]
PSSPTAAPLGGKGKKVVFVDANGNPVTTLDNDISIEMSYTKAEMVAAGFSSLGEIAKIKLAYWDESVSAYVSIPTTIAYDPASGATWENLVKVTFKGTTSHLTVFSAYAPQDGMAPAAPTDLAATAGNGQVTLNWTAPTTNADSSPLTDLLGYEVYRSTSANGTFSQVNTSDVLTTSYSDNTVANDTTYYYKVTTADTGGNESIFSGVSNAANPSDSITPLTIITTSPGDNATSVAVNTTIQVTFGESMNISSAESAFSIAPPENGSFSWSDNNTVMTFTPTDNLTYNKLYFVTISTTALSLAGNPLETDYVFSFRAELLSGCFIATASYGTETAEEIQILRDFRDSVLLTNKLGAEFVYLYYKYSPPIADFIAQHEVLRTIVREGTIDPIVVIVKWSHSLWSN